eukprot:1860705-Rhodomonas_salina.1
MPRLPLRRNTVVSDFAPRPSIRTVEAVHGCGALASHVTLQCCPLEGEGSTVTGQRAADLLLVVHSAVCQAHTPPAAHARLGAQSSAQCALNHNLVLKHISALRPSDVPPDHLLTFLPPGGWIDDDCDSHTFHLHASAPHNSPELHRVIVRFGNRVADRRVFGKEAIEDFATQGLFDLIPRSQVIVVCAVSVSRAVHYVGVPVCAVLEARADVPLHDVRRYGWFAVLAAPPWRKCAIALAREVEGIRPTGCISSAIRDSNTQQPDAKGALGCGLAAERPPADV